MLYPTASTMPKCVKSKYGCCWDRSTTAAAPVGSGKENCPGRLLCQIVYWCIDLLIDWLIEWSITLMIDWLDLSAIEGEGVQRCQLCGCRWRGLTTSKNISLATSKIRFMHCINMIRVSLFNYKILLNKVYHRNEKNLSNQCKFSRGIFQCLRHNSWRP